MPVVSQAQNRFMHAHERDQGPLGNAAREFVAATPPGGVKKLPERVGPKKAKPKLDPAPFGLAP